MQMIMFKLILQKTPYKKKLSMWNEWAWDWQIHEELGVLKNSQMNMIWKIYYHWYDILILHHNKFNFDLIQALADIFKCSKLLKQLFPAGRD